MTRCSRRTCPKLRYGETRSLLRQRTHWYPSFIARCPFVPFLDPCSCQSFCKVWTAKCQGLLPSIIWSHPTRSTLQHPWTLTQTVPCPKNIAELESNCFYQCQFIASAIRLLKLGGIMKYSTCTIDVRENEEMIWHILDEYPSMQLVLPGLLGLVLVMMNVHPCIILIHLMLKQILWAFLGSL